MKKKIVILATVLVMALSTSVAFAWTHFYTFSKSIGANSSAPIEFHSTSNYTLNYSQSVPNIEAPSTKVKIVISKEGGHLHTYYVTGDGVSKMIAVEDGAGDYTVRFYNQSNHQVNVSGSAMK